MHFFVSPTAGILRSIRINVCQYSLQMTQLAVLNVADQNKQINNPTKTSLYNRRSIELISLLDPSWLLDLLLADVRGSLWFSLTKHRLEVAMLTTMLVSPCGTPVRQFSPVSYW